MPITHTVRLLAPYRTCRFPFFRSPRMQAPSLRFLPPRHLLFVALVRRRCSHTRPADPRAKLGYRAEGLARELRHPIISEL